MHFTIYSLAKLIGYENYVQYLRSDHWIQIKCKYKKDKCFCCGSKKSLHLHHIEYQRLGYELPQDLITVCELCHKKIHKNINLKKVALQNAHISLKKKIIRNRTKKAKSKRRQKRKQSNY